MNLAKKTIETINKSYEDYIKSNPHNPNIERYVLLSNGKKYNIVDLYAEDENTISVIGVADEEELKIVMYHSQINIIFGKF